MSPKNYRVTVFVFIFALFLSMMPATGLFYTPQKRYQIQHINQSGDSQSLSQLGELPAGQQITSEKESEIRSQLASTFSGFIQNVGQSSEENLLYYYSTQNSYIGFYQGSILIKQQMSKVERIDASGTKTSSDSIVFTLSFNGANIISPRGVNKLNSATNFINGQFQANQVSTFNEIWYYSLYDKIDLRFYMTQEGMKYEFIVHPGGNPRDIQVQASNTVKLAIEDNQIHFQSPSSINGFVSDRNLFTYSGNSGQRLQNVDSQYVLNPNNHQIYGFSVGNYDTTQDLVIDPILGEFATFMGGSMDDTPLNIKVDNHGDVYVLIDTYSDFPTSIGAYLETAPASHCMLIIKISSVYTETRVIWSTFVTSSLGYIGGLEIDPFGNVYFAGTTTLAQFTHSTAYSTTFNGGTNDVYIGKLKADGTQLIAGTYLGGNGVDALGGIKLDKDNNLYVTGYTTSTNFPTSIGAYQQILAGGEDVFVAKLDSNLNSLLFGSYIGGTGNDRGFDMVFDNSGNSYVVGKTASTDFPTTVGAYDTTSNGGDDVFVFKLSKDASTLEFSTYFGAGFYQSSQAITLDPQGNIIIAGTTSTAIPTTVNAYSTVYSGGYDVFVTKFDPTGNSLIFSTMIGGSGNDVASDIATDSSGNIYFGGYTVDATTDYPIANAIYGGSSNHGLTDGFLSVLSSSGSNLIFSRFLGTPNTDEVRSFALDVNGSLYVTSYSNFPYLGGGGVYYDTVVSFMNLPSFETKLGGTGYDSAWDMAMDDLGNIYVTGTTASTNFPSTTGVYDTTANGGNDVFITKLNETGVVQWSTYLGGSGVDMGYGIALDSSGIYLTGSTQSTNFPTTVGAYQTSDSGSSHEGFITKLSLDGTTITYSTYMDMEGEHIVIDSSGNAYVTGEAFSDLTTTSNVVQSTFGGNQDAAVLKLNSGGTGVLFATFLGGAGNEFAESIAVDSDANVYVTGYTYSTDFPTYNALNSSNNGGADIFLTKLNSTGTGYNFSTYLGGSGDDAGLDLMVDSSANIYLVGSTADDLTNLGTTNDAYDSTINGNTDAFIMNISVTPSVVYSSFFGGSGNDLPYGMAMDNTEAIYIAGLTSSSDLPMSGTGQYSSSSTSSDGFVAKFNSTHGLELSSYLYASTGNDYINAIEVDSYGRIALAGDTSSASQDGWIMLSYLTDNSLPTILAANEFLEQNISFNYFPVTFVDENPGTYSYYVDGSLIISDQSYASGIEKSLFIPYLNEGNYTLTILVYDTNGNYETKDVTIISDFTAATISQPADVVIQPNLSGNTISWTIADLYPNLYNITIDGIITQMNVPWTNGTYSVNIDTLLPGSHIIQIATSDLTGNIATDTVNVYIDGINPDISHPTDILMGEGDVSQILQWTVGDVNPDNYVIYKNGTVISSGSWTVNGTLPMDLSTLTNGIYNITMQVFDAAGNSAFDAVIVEVDGQGPTIDVGTTSVIYSPELATSFSVNLSEIHWPGVYNVTMNGNLYTSDTAVAGNGPILVDISGLTEGTYNFVIYVYDSFGNVNSANKIITIDNSPPDVSTPSDITYAPGATGQTLTWAVGDISPGMYNITLDGAIYVTNTPWTNGSIIYDFSGLSVGTHTVIINVWDSFGHTTSHTVLVIVDDNIPIVNSPNDTGYYPGTTGNVLSWQVGDKDPARYEVWVSNYDGSGTPTLLYSDNIWSNGTLSFNIDGLPLGEYFLHIILWDVLGNWSEDFVQVSVDDIAPTVSSPPDMIYASDLASDAFPGISWDVSDTNPSYYNITVDGVLQREEFTWTTGVVQWGDVYSYGIHSIVLTMVDLAGNYVIDEVIVIWDNAAPIVSSPADFSYVEGSTGHVVTWDVSDLTGYTVRLYDNGNLVNEFQATIDDSYTLGADGWTAGTTNELKIEIVDLAGHSVTDSVLITVTAESTPTSSSTTSTLRQQQTSTTSSEDKGGQNKKSFLSYNPILIFNILGLALLGTFKRFRKSQ